MDIQVVQNKEYDQTFFILPTTAFKNDEEFEAFGDKLFDNYLEGCHDFDSIERFQVELGDENIDSGYVIELDYVDDQEKIKEIKKKIETGVE